VREANQPEKRAIALAWLFHLYGDIHQPLHTADIGGVPWPKPLLRELIGYFSRTPQNPRGSISMRRSIFVKDPRDFYAGWESVVIW
jgi:S1/P1 Nuclease